MHAGKLVEVSPERKHPNHWESREQAEVLADCLLLSASRDSLVGLRIARNHSRRELAVDPDRVGDEAPLWVKPVLAELDLREGGCMVVNSDIKA